MDHRMKKSKMNQKTLFSAWGNSKPSRSACVKQRDTGQSKIDSSDLIGFDAPDVIELDDEDDDDNLLAAVAEMDSIPEERTGDFQNSIAVDSCEVEHLPGFDLESGDVWIYPTNYPVRDYQYNIVDKALYKNTLVTLPTGLGKTFIAAVVMYNFYRWYPQGKIIFMAPTKPLVAQQIEACYKIMGIPQSDTAEMTGNMPPIKRESLWSSRRVFFLTPQVLQNDLSRGSCKADQVVLLVIDEAHKALGNHAYCQVVREVAGYHRNFRVLALSATPGDDIKAVQQVITNLLISQVELRSEESADIKPYTHDRTMEKIVVPLGDDVGRIKGKFLKVLEGVVGRLYCKRALWQKDPQRVSKYMLLSARDQFRKTNNERGGMSGPQVGAIEGDFAVCISLYHAYELLLQHGILSFYNFIKAIIDGSKGMARARTELTKNHDFSQAMDELKEQIEPPVEEDANTSGLFSQFSPKRQAMQNFPRPDPSFKSHPKLAKLEEVVLEHFEKFSGEVSGSCVNTRVMIFSQYRDSVKEITAILSKHRPVVRVMSFVGQATTSKASRGLTQKEQLEVVQRFRNGGYNTLVATCVGEEGLDIGEVDLIVCFDAHASPIRLVQRIGRTGRKRNGRIVILVTEGKEEQVYKRSQKSKNSIHRAVMQGAKSFELYNDNARMIPRHLTPRPYKMQMSMGTFVGHSKKKGKSDSAGSIQKFVSKSSTSTKKYDGLLTYEELVYWQEHYKLSGHEAGMTPQSALRKKSRRSTSGPHPVKELSLTEWLPWQTTPSTIGTVSHSRRTHHLVELLEFTELHGGRDEGDETYDLEMMSFLNEDDIVRPNSDVDEGLRDVDREEKEDEVASEKSRKKKKGPTEGAEETASKSADGARRRTTKSKQMNSKKVGESVPGKQGCKGAKERVEERRKKWKEFLKPFDADDQDSDFDCRDRNEEINDRAPDTEVCIDLDVHDLPQAPPEKDEKQNIAVTAPVLNEIEDEHEGEENASTLDLSGLLPTISPFTERVPCARSRHLQTAFVPTPPSLDSLQDFGAFTQEEKLEKMNQTRTMRSPSPVRLTACRRRLQGAVLDSEELGEDDDNDAKLQDNGVNNDIQHLFGTSTPSEKSPKVCRGDTILNSETPLARKSEPGLRSKRDVAVLSLDKRQAGDTELSVSVGVWCSDQNTLEADVTAGAMDSGFREFIKDDKAFVDVDFGSEYEEFCAPCKPDGNDGNRHWDLGAEPLQSAGSTMSASKPASLVVKLTDIRKSRCDDVPSPPRLQRTIAKLNAFQHKPRNDGCYPEKPASSCRARSLETGSTNEQEDGRAEVEGGVCHVEARGKSANDTLSLETRPRKVKMPSPVESRRSEMFCEDRPAVLDRLEEFKARATSVGVRKYEYSPASCQTNLSNYKRQSLSLKRSSPNEKATAVKTSDLRKDVTVTSPITEKIPSPQRPAGPCTESKLKTDGGGVVAVLESEEEEEEEEEEEDIRPVGRASRLRRRALSSPLSQEFKKPSVPSKPQLTANKHFPTAGYDSDEEFELGKNVRDVRRDTKSTCTWKGRSEHEQKRKERQRSETKNRTRHARLFLDEEAELSGSEINEFSSDESDDEEMEDSFINDASQLTQVTPACDRTRRSRSPVNMAAIYRQSLMSPTRNELRFRTPLFHKQKNKYKMVYGKRKADSQSESEAEEVNELEDEAESEAEEESLLCGAGEQVRAQSPDDASNSEHSPPNEGGSFDESQIGRPVKRVKRKRILDETLLEEDISPKCSKQKRGSDNACTNVSPICRQQQQFATNDQKSLQKSPSPYGNFPSRSVKHPQGSTAGVAFVRSSSICTRDKLSVDSTRVDSPPKRKTTAVVGPCARDAPKTPSFDVSSSLFSDSAIDMSDTELLGALDTSEVTNCVAQNKSVRTPEENRLKKQDDLQELAAAMALSDADMATQISEVPTFTLGFDFFGDDDQGLDNSNLGGTSNAKGDWFVGDSKRANSKTSLDQRAHVKGKQQSNSVAPSRDRQEKKSFTNVMPFDVEQSKQKQTSAEAGQKIEVHARKPLPSQEQKSAGSLLRPGPSRASSSLPSVQRSVNFVQARPQTALLSPLLTSSQKDKGKLVILVDTREISNSQIVSALRLKHGMKAEVCQLISCDYIVSNRMAVERRTVSDICNSNNIQKLVDRMRRMCDLFDRPCMIIEKDRLKAGETDKNFNKSRAYLYNLACISQTHIKILFSESQEETANLLSELAAIEAKKGAAIVAPTSISKENEKVFHFLLSIPKVSYVTALALSASHRTIHDVINSCPESLQRATKNMSASRASEIHRYLRQKFNSNMITAKK